MMRRASTYLILAVMGGLAIAGGFALERYCGHMLWTNAPFHSTAEALGAFVGIAMAYILLAGQRIGKECSPAPLALGFLSMGILDGFHAVVPPGQAFVFLHSAAGLAGGIGFASAWINSDQWRREWDRRLAFYVTAACVSIGLIALLAERTLPVMVSDGKFTNAAKVISILGGSLFLAAIPRFLACYQRFRRTEYFLFACMSVLFGIAGLTFGSSTLWDEAWWMWHLLRLIAYLLMLGVAVQAFRKTMIEVEKHRNWLETTLESIGDGVLATHANGTVALMNSVAGELTGWAHAEALGKPLNDVFHIINEQTRAKVANPVDRVLTEGALLGLANHTVLLAKDGRETPIADSAAPIKTIAGEIIGAVLVFRDATGERALEKANKELASYKADLERRVDERTAELQKNEHELQLALDGLKAGLWSWNIRTNVNHWDAAMHDLFGLEQGTFDGTYEAWAALVHPDDIEAADNAVKAALAGGPKYDAIWRTKDQAKTGEWRVLRATALVERDEDGEPLQMTGICFDVTEERSADEANQRLAAIVTSTDDAIIGKSHDGSIQSWNKAAERLYGYCEDEVKGCSIDMLIPPENRGEYAVNMAKIQKGEFVHHHETVRLAKDGTKIDVSLSMSPIRDSEGALIGVSAIERDIREIKAHREKLESLVKERSAQLAVRNTDLERSNRDLQSLLYVISHDLREPLRAIENFSRMVQNRYAKEIDEKGQDFLQRVVNASKRLDGLLDDVLILSRAQRMVQPNETINLRDVVNEAIKRLEDRIKQTDARVEVTGEFHSVVADATWLTQGVYNLIANAVKFTRKGERPDVDITPYASDNMYGVSVCDRGPGVPEEHRDRIFEMFQRAVGRDIEGTGAGLAIVQQIAERHGGKVWMEPREGGGSRFILAMVNEMDNKTTEGEKS